MFANRDSLGGLLVMESFMSHFFQVFRVFVTCQRIVFLSC